MAETVSPELQPILKRAELGHRLIWTVITTGILSFVAIIYFAEVNPTGHSNRIQPLLWLSGTAFAVASVLVPKVLLFTHPLILAQPFSSSATSGASSSVPIKGRHR
jgi:hypothetical protein